MLDRVRILGVFFALLLASCAWQPHGLRSDRSAASHPLPIESLAHKDADRSSQRREWIERMHRAAPGEDWRTIDAHYLADALQRRMQARQHARALGRGPQSWSRIDLPGPWVGEWVERGSDNQSGRIIAADYDPATDRLIAYAHGGQLWRASLASLEWASLNDAVQFRPNGTGGRFLRLKRPDGRGDRLLVASDRPAGVYLSDDLGVTWELAGGFPSDNAWYAHGLVVRGPGPDEVYLLRHYIDAVTQTWRPHLFASTDAGANFASLGPVGQRNRAALFAPRYDSAEVFVLADTSLYRVATGSQALEFVATLPIADADLANRTALLTGGVDGNGEVFLYAIYSLSGTSTLGTARVFRSLDAGHTWTERSQAPTGAFAYNSAASSTRDPDRIYLGGVEVYRSHDGGLGWTRVNTWQSYYAQPGTRLHADIPSIDVVRDGPLERIFIGTDGGLYQSTDALLSVENLSLSGLRVSQYYGSYTVRSEPYAILAGAQDQGFQKATAPGHGLQDFVQTISGDYGHLVSGNDGGQLWSNYPGFTLLDLAPLATDQSSLRSWNFTNSGFTGWLFLAPMVADPVLPNRIHLAGGRLGGGTSHRIIQLTWTGTQFQASQSSQDFGSQITALAIDGDNPQLHYAMTSARTFFRSLDGGQTWSQTSSNLPQNHYFWGQRILIDPVVAGRLYVAGSGYSNPPVFVSNDGGLTFEPFATGLPSTLVFDLAMSSDGEHLFAATEVGPFRYDPLSASWTDITSLDGPAQTFWHVDYIEELGLARFSTYGRGLWDFQLSHDRIFADDFEP